MQDDTVNIIKQNCPPINEQSFYWWANGGQWATCGYLFTIPLFLLSLFKLSIFHYFIASSTATATATEAPTIGLLPIPISPIISTCAGTDELPAELCI